MIRSAGTFLAISLKKVMASKERKGGLLRNEDVERELERTGKNEQDARGYRGTQDTGDDGVRERGTEVQQQDGIGTESEEKDG